MSRSRDTVTKIRSFSTAQTELIVATTNQTIFNLVSTTYVPGTNNLVVYVDGLRARLTTDYTESNSTQVIFTSGLIVGTEVLFTVGESLNTTALSAASVSYTQGGTGAVLRNAEIKLREIVSVKDFGALGDGVSNDAIAIQTAINTLGNGARIYFPPGTYKATSPILAENLKGLRIMAAGGQPGQSGARLVGSHTGKAVISFVGSTNCVVDSLSVEGDTAARPKTGILLGRSSSTAAGNHTFYSPVVSGFFTVSGVYNVASEYNTWVNTIVNCTVSPLCSWYESQADNSGITGLTAASMKGTTVIGGSVTNSDVTAGSTCLYLDCGATTGFMDWYNVYFVKTGGQSFTKVRLGFIDNLDTLLPIGFHSCSGEHVTTAPTHGLYLTANAERFLSGFEADVGFTTPATNDIFTDPGTVVLVGAKISTPWKPSLQRAAVFHKVEQSELSLLSENTITAASIVGSLIKHSIVTLAITIDQANIYFQSTAGTKIVKLVNKRIQPTYGTTITINNDIAGEFEVTATNNTGFTIANPATLSAGQDVTVTIRNTAGVALGAVTWGNLYKLATWTNPATGFSRTISFACNGTNWVERSRTTIDIPN